MKTFAKKLRERLHHLNRDFTIVDDVTIVLEAGVCAEEIGDELVLWLHHHGMRAKRLDRTQRGIVRFGFATHEAAATFRRTFDFLLK